MFWFVFPEGGICSCTNAIPPVEHISPDDEDVLEEENIVKQQTAEGLVDENVAVQIRGLAKIYPGTTKVGFCRCKRTSPYHAIKVKIKTYLYSSFASIQICYTCPLSPGYSERKHSKIGCFGCKELHPTMILRYTNVFIQQSFAITCVYRNLSYTSVGF